MLRVPLVGSLVELATGFGCSSSWSPSPQARPELVDHDFTRLLGLPPEPFGSVLHPSVANRSLYST
jgi:hypothetical protein